MYRVLQPRWSMPLRFSEKRLSVLINKMPGPGICAAVSKGNNSLIPLQCLRSQALDANSATWNLALHEDIATGLYDLHILHGDRCVAREPNCLWHMADATQCRRFVHISDLHLHSPGRQIMLNRESAVTDLMQRIADSRPEFIINTGDLISRYGPDRKPLPISAICHQIRRVREIMLSVQIPHFITPGNHDLAFTDVTAEWNRCIGPARHGFKHHYSFKYGNCRFLMLDRSCCYDANHRPQNTALSDQDRQWLRHELRSSKSEELLFLCCHYDYHNELPALMQHHHPPQLVLYGHSDKGCLPPEWQTRDGGLRSPYIGQIIEIKDKKITRSGMTLQQSSPNGDQCRTCIGSARVTS